MSVVQGMAGDLMRLPERPLCEHHYLLGRAGTGRYHIVSVYRKQDRLL